jgi:hypothetical protein
MAQPAPKFTLSAAYGSPSSGAAVFAVVKDFDEKQDGAIQSFNAGLGVLQSWLRELLVEALP